MACAAIGLATATGGSFANSLVDEIAAAMRFHWFMWDGVKRVFVSAIESSWRAAEDRAWPLARRSP